MRILAISDLRIHGIELVEQVAARLAPDLILYAGDDVERFVDGENSWSPLAQRTPLGLAGVLGNDCFPESARAFEQPGCHDLHRAPLIVDGLAILGLQGAPRDEGHPIGPTLYSKASARAHLERQLASIGRKPALLVSHAPPRDVLDFSIRFGAGPTGSTVVREFANRARVRGIVCGHAHLHGGKSQQVGNCVVVNVASHDDPSAKLKYALLDWDGRRVSVDHIGSVKAGGMLGHLPGFGRKKAAQLAQHGILSPAELLAADDRTLLDAFSTAEGARRARAQARAHVEGVPVVIDPRPRVCDDGVILDIETSLEQNDPWLVGFKRWGAGESVSQLQELDPDRHEAHLRRVGKALSPLSPLRITQWGPFDCGALKRAHRRLGTDLPTWLQTATAVDAGKWLQRVVALPLPDYKLKTVAAYFRYPFAATGLSGLEAGLWYSRFKRDRTPFDVDLVCSYNRDDVLAVEHNVNSVLTMITQRAATLEPAIRVAVSTRGVDRYRTSLDARVARGELSVVARDAAVTNYSRAMAQRSAGAR